MRRGSPNLAIAEASPHVAPDRSCLDSIARSIAISRSRPAAAAVAGRPGRPAGRPGRPTASVRAPAARSGWPFAKPFAALIASRLRRASACQNCGGARRLVRQPPQPPLGRPTHVRMERERSSETMQPGSKVAKVECSESSSGGSSPSNSPPAGERCHLAPGLLQEARCPAPSSKLGLRSCGACSKPVGCSQSSIYMAFDRPFCSTSCREKAVLEHFTRSLPAFDLPPSSNQHFSAVLAG